MPDWQPKSLFQLQLTSANALVGRIFSPDNILALPPAPTNSDLAVALHPSSTIMTVILCYFYALYIRFNTISNDFQFDSARTNKQSSSQSII